MTLRTDNREFRVAQSGPDFMLLVEPASFPAGEALFIISIDGDVRESKTHVEATKNSTKVYAAKRHAPAALKVAES